MAIKRKTKKNLLKRVKRCGRCWEEKLLSDFHKSVANHDGHQNACKVCQNKLTKKYYREHSDYLREYAKIYYKKNREKMLKKSRKYYINNIDSIKAYFIKNRKKIAKMAKAYKLANLDKLRAYSREYYQKNKERLLKRQRKRYLQKKREQLRGSK